MKELEKKYIYIMFAFAYIFSLVIRYLWIYQYSGNPEVIWNGSYIINTNDGYFFGSGVQKTLYSMHQLNPLVPSVFDRGLTFLTTILVKITPFSLETIMFYLPAIISSIIVFPMILIGNLYKKPLWGFFSALIASIAWSYYNRTMIGYYDTDMFAIMLLMWVFYYLLKSIHEHGLNSSLIASIILVVFPFFYQSSHMVIYALLIFYALYILYDSKFSNDTFKKLTLLFLSASPLPIISPYNMIISLVIVVMLYVLFNKKELSKNVLIALSLFSFILLLYFGDIFLAIYGKVQTYLHKGVELKGLKFYGVYQTVAEANGIPFFAQGQINSVANRTIGSSIAFIIAAIGYVYLIFKRKEFLITLPLIGIGIFAHWGGLRFTIYGLPFFALAFVFLIDEISNFLTQNKLQKIAIATFATLVVLYTNINHAWEYNKAITPVFTKSEINQLDELKKVANPKDFTLTWWDYGYPIWFYTNTNTLIDGGKHHHDNFIISKMLISNSSQLAYNLAIKSVETYVKAINSYQNWKKDGAKLDKIQKEFDFTTSKSKHYHAGNPRAPVINILLKNNQPNQLEPNEELEKMENNDYKLPPKTREIYFYMPLKAVRIFPTISDFSNLDLTTGKPKRDMLFYPAYLRGAKNGILFFGRDITFNTKTGVLKTANQHEKIASFIIAIHKDNGDIEIKPFRFSSNSNRSIIYLQNIQTIILLDNQTLNSNYVKMFLLGIYDKNLFELVNATKYGRVYKIKRN